MTGTGLLQNYLDAQAELRPESTALVHGSARLTYGQLADWTNRIARLLIDSGCRKGDRIGLLLPKSFEAIVGELAALKAGAIYVPMDPASPSARLRLIVDSAESRFILAGGSGEKLLNQLFPDGEIGDSVHVGWMTQGAPADSPWQPAFTTRDVLGVSGEPLDYASSADDVAHLLFTSGSTGIPKGVMITHANVTHFVEWANSYFGLTPEDRISAHPPLHFDLSTFDIYGTIAAGAQLHLVPPELNLVPHRLADFIRNSELTQWFSVPSLLNYMAKMDAIRQDDFPALKRLLWCGEAFPTPALMHWMKRLPRVTFTNLYGPTETTIASSYYRMPACPASESDPIPIGEPCGGELLFVLDEDLKPVPQGEQGDLYIGGVGLSPGYWRNPDKTAAAFIEDSGNSGRGRIYRTGDLASEGADGLVYLHGRADHQIKSRGYRIELGEIEHAIHTLPFIHECAVIAADTDSFEGKTICCAFVLAQGSEAGPNLIRAELSQLLPAYMIPARWCALTSLPLNGNGKIDRPALRKNFENQPESAMAGSR
jgi:amino acid adenylation domain-containing protein